MRIRHPDQDATSHEMKQIALTLWRESAGKNHRQQCRLAIVSDTLCIALVSVGGELLVTLVPFDMGNPTDQNAS
jgi:hypothetical protein